MTVLRSAGFSLIELLVALVLAGVLAGSAAGILTTLARSTERSVDRWDRLEAMRTVWVTTERELRSGRAGRDWRVTAGGVLDLRAFRGFARICGGAVEPGLYPVAWRGERLPLEGRDSLLVLGRDGGWRAAGLERWSEAAATEAGGDPTGCAAGTGERSGWMSWSGAGSEVPVLVRLFERGAYSFHAGAFRYARGAAGRQPLTPELFGDASRYVHGGPAGVEVLMGFDAPARGPRSSSFRDARLRIHPGQRGGAAGSADGGG